MVQYPDTSLLVLTLCMFSNLCSVIFHSFVLVCADFFSKLTYSKKSFRNTIRGSNSLDPDRDRHSVGPDLGPNCLQRLSADDKNHH